MENEEQFSDLRKTGLMDDQSDCKIDSSQTCFKVSDIMRNDVITITPGEAMVSVAKVMSNNNVSCLVVVDNANVVGILTEKDLLKVITDKGKDLSKMTVAEIMSSPVESIPPDLCIVDAGRIMEAKNIKRLPILDGKRLIGIVTQTDLTRALASYGMWKDVSDIMSSNVAVVQTKATVAKAAEFMSSGNISCIIAMKDNEVQGIITERDLLKRVIALQKNPAQIKVEEVMSSPVIAVPPSHSVFSACTTMDKRHVRRLVVMDDERLCGVVTQTDIFRAVKKKLEDEQEKNSLFLENSESNIFTLDSAYKVTYVNQAFMKLFEISDPAELVDQPFLPERFWVDPEERRHYLRELQKGDTEIRELGLKTSKGRRIYVTIFSTFTRNIHGEINGTQGIIYDATERKRSEEAIKTAYEELEGAHRQLKEMQSQIVQNEKLASIGQLAAGVAHEMNSPVGFIASNFQTLENYVKKIRDMLVRYEALIEQIEASGNLELRNMAEDIGQFRDDMKIDFILEDIGGLFDDSREGLERVTDIIQNLKDFSRIDQPGSRDEYDINKGIESTLVVARNEIKYDAEVKTEFSELPMIFCQSGQINQVFLNIIVNAAQAIKSQERDDKGTITIKTYASDGGVVCEISDDGPGIPPDKVSKVFDPFFTTKPAGKGTGLGLSVSYDIVANKHNGKLLVDSTVGEGTKFTIKLPVGTREND